MEKFPSALTPAAIPAEIAAESLLKESADLHAAPRSYAIEMPRDIRAFANAMRNIARLPVECSITFDRTRNILVVETGELDGTVHLFLRLNPHARVPLNERLRTGPEVHLHPPQPTDWIKTTPSGFDWRTLYTISEHTNINESWILSPKGITRFSFPHPEHNEKKYGELILAFDRIPDSAYTHGVPEDDPLNSEQQKIWENLEYQAAKEVGGEIEIIPWENEEEIEKELLKFLSHCK